MCLLLPSIRTTVALSPPGLAPIPGSAPSTPHGRNRRGRAAGLGGWDMYVWRMAVGVSYGWHSLRAYLVETGNHMRLDRH